MDDLLPRADISGQLAGEVIGKLGSANWKERKEGLDEVEAILAAAGGRIQPCVSGALAQAVCFVVFECMCAQFGACRAFRQDARQHAYTLLRLSCYVCTGG